MGIPSLKQSGSLKDIDYVVIKENVLESSDMGGSFFHIYIQIKDVELYLLQLTDWQNFTEARKLALFWGCTLKHTDNWPLKEGTYERIESLEEIQSHLSTAQPPNNTLKHNARLSFALCTLLQ